MATSSAEALRLDEEIQEALVDLRLRFKDVKNKKYAASRLVELEKRFEEQVEEIKRLLQEAKFKREEATAELEKRLEEQKEEIKTLAASLAEERTLRSTLNKH